MKKLIKLLLCGMMLIPTGCHGSQSTAEFAMPESFDTSKTYEVTFWAKNDTNKNQTAVYKKAISDFEELYPNIKINLKLYTDYSKIYNDVITNISTNTTPDVCITYPDHIATYLSGTNTVVPLDSLMDDEKYGLGGSEVKYDSVEKDEIISEYLEECKLDGHYYALPFMRSSEVVYINANYVHALGYEIPDVLTWDFIFEVSEAATKKNEDGTYALNGQNVMIPFIYKSTDNMMIQMLKQKGASYSEEDGTIEIFNDDTKEILGMIAEHSESGAFSTFKISSYPANFLNAGQCIFAIDSTAGSTWMGSDAPLSDIAEENKVQFTTEVRMVPQYDTEDPYMISQGPSVCIFNKDDPNQVVASWLFAQYLLTNDVQIGYSETEGYVPVTSKARNTEEYQTYLNEEGTDNEDHYSVKIEATKVLLENVEHTFTTAVFNGSASLRDAAGALIEDTVKAVRRHQTIDDSFIEEEFENVNSLYRLEQIGTTTSTDTPLPTTAKLLLGCLIVAWIGIITQVIKKTHGFNRVDDSE